MSRDPATVCEGDTANQTARQERKVLVQDGVWGCWECTIKKVLLLYKTLLSTYSCFHCFYCVIIFPSCVNKPRTKGKNSPHSLKVLAKYASGYTFPFITKVEGHTLRAHALTCTFLEQILFQVFQISEMILYGTFKWNVMCLHET